MFIFRKENGLDADYVKIVKNSSQQNDWTFKAVDAYQVTSHVIWFKTIEVWKRKICGHSQNRESINIFLQQNIFLY